MFKTRLFSGIILVALMLLFIIPGGNLLLLGVAFLALVAMMEILRVAKLHKSLPGLLGYGAVLLVCAGFGGRTCADTESIYETDSVAGTSD